MTTLAANWWDSGSWWQLAITIAASLMVGAAGALATLRAANPKRKITWWVQSNTPIVNERYPRARTASAGGMAVTLDGHTLAQPRVVELIIANTGRRDITAAMFHDGDPISFGFDVDVCTILDATTKPAGSTQPVLHTGAFSATDPIGFADKHVEVAPSLLRRGQVVTVTVLLNGEEEPVQCTDFPLVDVKMANESLGSALSAVVESTTIRLWPFGINIHLGGRNR
ncbi:hypothetical protein ACFRMO_08130 [Streptomyces anulatus]|uniref:hypothetical protein n=1 Tax=Streptomyces anulatus TaxID=1892 RepID=UPI003674A706